MILRVYAVYDQAVGAFMRPFMCRSDGEASRMFLASVANNEDFHRNYRDYALFYLSEFNDVTGEYGVPHDEKVSVPRGVMTGMQAFKMVQDKQAPVALKSTPASPVDLSDEAQLASNG